MTASVHHLTTCLDFTRAVLEEIETVEPAAVGSATPQAFVSKAKEAGDEVDVDVVYENKTSVSLKLPTYSECRVCAFLVYSRSSSKHMYIALLLSIWGTSVSTLGYQWWCYSMSSLLEYS